jgi:hypothetical protein
MGTGKALAIAERGDCDVVLVHPPEAETAFVAKGFGEARRPVTYEDFVLLGPPEDPAGARGTDAAEALRTIARMGAAFCSRGDESGTHQKERDLWREAGLEPQRDAPRYQETGQGMGSTLMQASERAYVLADRGTVLAYRGRLDLVVLGAFRVGGEASSTRMHGDGSGGPARLKRAESKRPISTVGRAMAVRATTRHARRPGKRLRPRRTPSGAPARAASPVAAPEHRSEGTIASATATGQGSPRCSRSSPCSAGRTGGRSTSSAGRPASGTSHCAAA